MSVSHMQDALTASVSEIIGDLELDRLLSRKQEGAGEATQVKQEKVEFLHEKRQTKGKIPLPKAKIRPMARGGNIVPDPFQVRSIEAAKQGKDVLVVAPTGTGKTLIPEKLAEQALAEKSGLVYASPIKSLSNEKYRSFARKLGEDNVGLLTGDIVINPYAPIMIMTTEIFRNKAIGSPDSLEWTRWVAIDEFHLIDSDRGYAWEESIIFAPQHMNVVCLSATVPNYEQIAAWISAVRGKEVEVVVESKRSVPLEWKWFIQGREYDEKQAARKLKELEDQKEQATAAMEALASAAS